MRRTLRIAAFGIVPLILAACSGGGGGASPTASSAQATSTETAAATETAVPTATQAATASPPGVTVMATSVGSIGVVLVDGASGRTVYTFTKDTKDSGTSNCTGGCIQTWPPLTIPAGTTPAGGDGVNGQLGTITRVDDGSLQVTYNGLPLYFFSGDNAPGDANGVYPNWEAVKP